MSEFADWTRAFVMMAHDGTVYRPVLVDDLGNLYALLRGETVDEELKTVRLDDQGRLSAFVIDSVDAWTRMLAIGNAELAVRLGSSVAYDRRGQVLFAESFENGLSRWALTEGGDGAAVEITPEITATGGYGVKLTGGKDGAKLARVRRRVPTRPLGRMGLELTFSVPGSWDYILVSMAFRTGTYEFDAAVKFVFATGNLMVRDEDVGYVTVGSGAALGAALQWLNTMKLVANVDTMGYVRLMFNHQEIDISAYTVKTDDDPGAPPGIKVDIALYSRDTYNDVMYIDDIILTGAEPE